MPNTEGVFGAADTTYREIVHISLGGSPVRIILSNEFGLDPLTIDAANIALRTTGSGIDPTRQHTHLRRTPLHHHPTRSPRRQRPRQPKLSSFADLAVSLFVPAQTMQQISHHSFADQTSYTAPGNVVSDKALESPTEIY